VQLLGYDLIGIIGTCWDKSWLSRTGWDGEEGEFLLHVRAMGMHGALRKDGQRTGRELMGQD